MKAVIYARYSSDNQREESITAQVRACREYCRQRGHVVVREYIDEAFTGRSDDRPDFQKMIRDAKTGAFDLVVCHKINRFSRDKYDDAHYKKVLLKSGVRVEFVAQPVEDSKEGRLMESVLVGLAQYESENLSEEIKKGQKENAYQARHNGGVPALGYDKGPDGKYVINEGEAAIVRLIFDMRAVGRSYSAILDELNKRGLRTKAGSPFGRNSLYEILQNKKYIGVYTFGRVPRKRGVPRNSHKNNPNAIEVSGGVPAIVPIDVWDKVQDMILRTKHRPGTYKATVPYLLAGLARCECGGAMVGWSTSARGNGYRYYRCANVQKKTCKSGGIRADVFESMVMRMVRLALGRDRAELRAAIRRCLAQSQQDFEDETIHLKKEKDHILKKIDNLLRLAETGDVDGLVMDRIRGHKQRLGEIEAAIATAGQAVLDFSDNEIDEALDTLLEETEKGPEEIRAALPKVVGSIVVRKDGIDIDILPRFGFDGAREGT